MAVPHAIVRNQPFVSSRVPLKECLESPVRRWANSNHSTALYNGGLTKVYIIETMIQRLRKMRFITRLAAIGFAAALSFFVASSAIQAEDIYVNNVSGDDRLNGRPMEDSSSNSGPVKSITRALNLARQGDRIVIEKTDQPYRESLSLQGLKHSGTAYRPFTIVSDGAILDGTSSISPRSWEHYSNNVFRFMPELKSYQQIYINGKPAERVRSNFEAYIPDLEPGQWSLVDGWVYFCCDPGKAPTQYDVRYCKHQTGITLYEVNHVLIRGLVVQGFQLDAVNAHDAVDNASIDLCKLRGNGRSGLSIGGASRFRLDNCIVGANGGAQVRTEGYCKLEIKDCRLLESDSTGPAVQRDGGTISVDGQEYGQALSLSRRKP